MKEDAVKYVKGYGNLHSLSIFPLNGKVPFKGSHGYKDATKDEKQIEKWWTEHPRANIGIPTGEENDLISIDVDIKHDQGKFGDESIRDLERELGELPETWQVITGSGGMHYYFRYPKGYDIRDSASVIAPYIDIRANGGYVVAPPSIHPETGRVYEWEGSSDPEDIPLAELPEKWLQRLIGKSKNSKASESTAFELPEIISEGGKGKIGRNDTLFRYGASLRAKNVKALKIWDLLREANEKNCNPSMKIEEVEQIYNSVMKYQSGKAEEEIISAEEAEAEKDFLRRFHFFSEKGKPTGVFDWEIIQYLKEVKNIFVLGSIPFIYNNGVYKADSTGSEIITMIGQLIYPVLRRYPTIKRVYDLLIKDSELQVTAEDLNDYPQEWINFKNGFYDPIGKKLIPHDPIYKAVNQIPHEYDPEGGLKGEKVLKWLEYICPSLDDREMLLQYSGLCMTRDVRQQKFMIIQGEGGSGKSTLIKLFDRMIGVENISNISLNQLSQRFFAYGLMGKLLNSCADLEIDALSDVSTLKKVLGEDAILAEPKGKDPFSFNSYAKLIFSTNQLPIVKEEKTNGFYRRLLILTMDRVPETRDPKFFDVLAAEIDDFIRLSVEALERMYQNGKITESASSKEAVKRLRCDSDTVEAFLNDDEIVVIKQTSSIKKLTLFEKYEAYCKDLERQPLTKQNFYRSMRLKGYGEKIVGGVHFFRGVEINENITQTSPETSPKEIPKGFSTAEDEKKLPFE